MYLLESDHSLFTVGEYENGAFKHLRKPQVSAPHELANFARTKKRGTGYRGSQVAKSPPTRKKVSPSKYRPQPTPSPQNPFGGSNVTKKGNVKGSGIVKVVTKTGKTYIRKGKAAGRLARRKVKKAFAPGVKSGAKNIGYGARQMAGDAYQGTLNRGRRVAGAISNNRLRAAGGAAAVGLAGYGAYKFLTRKKRRRA